MSLQGMCADNTSEHIAVGTSDAVAYALTLDAITHRGPAQPARIPASVCAQPHMPGVDPGTYQRNLSQLNTALTTNWSAAPTATAEPALKPYVYTRH